MDELYKDLIKALKRNLALAYTAVGVQFLVILALILLYFI